MFDINNLYPIVSYNIVLIVINIKHFNISPQTETQCPSRYYFVKFILINIFYTNNNCLT